MKAALFTWAALLLCMPQVFAEQAQPLVLERMGVMFVGGREVDMTSAGRFGVGLQIVDRR